MPAPQTNDSVLGSIVNQAGSGLAAAGDAAYDTAASVGGIINSAITGVTEEGKARTSEAEKEANKQTAKGNNPVKDSVPDRVKGAKDAVGDYMKQKGHEANAEEAEQKSKIST